MNNYIKASAMAMSLVAVVSSCDMDAPTISSTVVFLLMTPWKNLIPLRSSVKLNANQNTPTYNLACRAASKGLLIQNGKKFIK
ncbi:MAG: hypothetical protein MR924_08155 [Prevotella sp.]|nr:hypothetical protein [Prevotella sp.]